MSQQSKASVPAPVRVSGGVPWWLWLVLVVFGGSIVATLVRKSIPEDPAMYYQQGMIGLEKSDAILVEKSIEQLKKFPDYASRKKMLEGMLTLGKSSPLRAIPLLKEASEDSGIRIKALSHLGSAYLRSNQRENGIAVYETILKEDENADDARLTLAGVLKDLLSWDESLRHLEILRDRNVRLGVVHNMIAEIYAGMWRFEDAAAEYKAALQADPTDVINSQKALGLVTCRLETGDTKGLKEFAELIDSETHRQCLSALEQSDQNEHDKGLASVQKLLDENPENSLANRVYGQIVLKIGSKEKAVETLKMLRTPLELNGRDLALFEVAESLAALAEEKELAAVIQQNIEQLKQRQLQLIAKLKEVTGNRSDTQARLELGDLAAEIGRMQFAEKIYKSVSQIDTAMESTTDEKIQLLYGLRSPFVTLDDAFINFESDVVVDEPTSDVKESPAPEGEVNELAFPELPAGAGKIDEKAESTFTTTESGLKYRILRKGSEVKPTANQTVEVHYHGWLDNQTVFDSSYTRGESISFPLNGVIPGWTEGMQLVGSGGMIELEIPPKLGYGAQGAGAAVPPNARLHFLVELISIK